MSKKMLDQPVKRLTLLGSLWFVLTFFISIGSAFATVPSVIINNDMDNDDVAALMFLGQAMNEGVIKIAAVTVVNDGANLPGVGLSQARCLLNRIGLGRIPTSDSAVTVSSTGNVFPNAVRGISGQNVPGSVGNTIEFASGCAVPTGSTVPAPEGMAVSLMEDTLDNAKTPMILLTFGPLTDIAQMLTERPDLVSKISQIYIMGGSTVGGNLFGVPSFFTTNTQEFNFWVDPPADQVVLKALSGKIHLTQLKGSNWVPLSKSFRVKLQNNRNTEAAKIVYGLAHAPASSPVGEADDGFGFLYWWDPLNAVAALFSDVVQYTPNVPIHVIQPDALIPTVIHNVNEGQVIVDTALNSNGGFVANGEYVPSIDLNGNGMLDYHVNLDPSLGGGSFTIGNPVPFDEVANVADKFHRCFLNVLNENMSFQNNSFPATSKDCN